MKDKKTTENTEKPSVFSKRIYHKINIGRIVMDDID